MRRPESDADARAARLNDVRIDYAWQDARDQGEFGLQQILHPHMLIEGGEVDVDARLSNLAHAQRAGREICKARNEAEWHNDGAPIPQINDESPTANTCTGRPRTCVGPWWRQPISSC